LKFAANYLAQNLSPSSSLLPKTTQKPGKYSRIELSLLSHSNNIFHREGYELLITPQKISITALTPAGIFYGIQTLIQLLPTDLKCRHTESDWNYPVPCLRIIDYPRFEWRGLMLDVSRHFFTKHDVKKYIDQMVKYKFNTLHLHLTDDHGWRIEIKSQPRLTEVGAWRVERYGEFGTRKKTEPGEKATYGGYYTHEDIKELVNYAAKRHVTIVPQLLHIHT
jgi:hexosaminidase